MFEINHVTNFVIKFLRQDDIHEFLPPIYTGILRVFPGAFISKLKFCLNRRLKFGIIFIIFKELLQIVILGNLEEISFFDLISTKWSPIELFLFTLHNIRFILFLFLLYRRFYVGILFLLTSFLSCIILLFLILLNLLSYLFLLNNLFKCLFHVFDSFPVPDLRA